METFVRTVNEMKETILVPSRLLDLAVGDDADTICLKSHRHSSATIKDTLGNTDLYRLYNIINQMKVELLWSKESSANSESDEQKADRLGHVRCPSTTSMQSVQSASSIASSTSSSSDSDSDAVIENDSGLESEDNDRLANQAAENFRRHLRGLHRSINRMTEAAEYLTLRYQADVGGQV